MQLTTIQESNDRKDGEYEIKGVYDTKRESI